MAPHNWYKENFSSKPHEKNFCNSMYFWVDEANEGSNPLNCTAGNPFFKVIPFVRNFFNVFRPWTFSQKTLIFLLIFWYRLNLVQGESAKRWCIWTVKTCFLLLFASNKSRKQVFTVHTHHFFTFPLHLVEAISKNQ